MQTVYRDSLAARLGTGNYWTGIIELEIIELLKHLRSVVPNSLNFDKLVLPDVNESEQNWVGIAVIWKISLFSNVALFVFRFMRSV